MKIPLKAAFVVLFLVIIIISFLIFIQSESKIESSDNSSINYEKLNEIVFSVQTQTVTKGDLIKSVSATGLVKPNKQLEIISNISGYIVRLNTYEGAVAKMNDVLVKFDDREYKIAMTEAEANLLNAKIEYGFYSREEAMPVDKNKVDSINTELLKLEDLFAKKKITEEKYLAKKDELDLALLFTGAKRNEILLYKSGMTNAINALNRAKLNLNYTEIIAPFDGVIANFNLVENQRINAGQKLFDILDVSRLKVEVGILENEINKIKIGSLANIKLNAVTNKVYRGRVIQINPVIDSENKTSKVTVEIIDKDYNIKPGMFAHVNIETEIFKNRVLIPKEALLVRDGRNLVFVAENDVAKWRYVTIGEQNENYIEIINGVQPDEKVIIEGQYNLAHESKIKLIE